MYLVSPADIEPAPLVLGTFGAPPRVFAVGAMYRHALTTGYIADYIVARDGRTAARELDKAIIKTLD